MKLVLAAQSSADRANLSPTAERLVNCYAVPAPEGSVAPLVIRSVPGLLEYVTLPGPFLRAMTRVEDRLYVVTAGGLYMVRDDGTSVFLNEVPDDPETSMSGHRDKVAISANGVYFVWNGSDLLQPPGGTLPAVGSVAFLDQFTLMGERGGRRVEWSIVGDPTARNGLYFATAEARDDRIIRVIEAGAYFAVLKEHSVELWGNSGAGGSGAFIRLEGAVIDRGARDYNLITKTPDGVFYIGEDNVAYLTTGLSPAVVSPPNVAQAIRDGQPTHCFYYEDRGHQFHVIRFEDRPAWVYDASTRLWHERSSGTGHRPWDVIAAAFVYERWHLGDRFGRIFRTGANASDALAPLRRTIVTRPIYLGPRFSVTEFEVLGLFGNYNVEEPAPNWLTDEYGFVLEDEAGQPIIADGEADGSTWERPGRIWIRLSRDGGHTFGVAKMQEIGRRGKFETKAKWYSLGQYGHLTIEINMTDPVDVPLLSEAEITLSYRDRRSGFAYA